MVHGQMPREYQKEEGGMEVNLPQELRRGEPSDLSLVYFKLIPTNTDESPFCSDLSTTSAVSNTSGWLS